MPHNFDVFIARAHDRFVQNYHENNRPNADWWGCFAYNDASVIIGGGVGNFSWHANRRDLCLYITEVLPYITNTSGQDGAVAEVTTAITANMQHGVISDEDGIERLNHILKHYSQINWIGTFAELCNSDDKFCERVRYWYREQIDDDDDDQHADVDHYAPIRPDEIDEFCEAISEYGL